MRAVKQSTARTIMVLMVDSTDHVTGKTGLTLTITASKAGAAFASISPTVTERGSGWYSLALTTAHLDTLGDFALHVTGSAADPADLIMEVVAYDPADAAGLGLSRIDAAISSRSTYAGADTAGTTTLLDRLTAIRAALIDNLDAAISSRLAAAGYTAPDNAGIAAVKAQTDNLPADPADESSLQAAIATRLASASYVAPDNAGISAAESAASAAELASEAVNARLPVDPADESTLEAAIATRAAPGDAMTLAGSAIDAILDEAVEDTVTLRQALRVLLAVLAGKSSGAPSGPIIYRDSGDTKARVTGTIDENGNRTAVVIDAE